MVASGARYDIRYYGFVHGDELPSRLFVFILPINTGHLSLYKYKIRKQGYAHELSAQTIYVADGKAPSVFTLQTMALFGYVFVS